MSIRITMPEVILEDLNNWKWNGKPYYMTKHMYRGSKVEPFVDISNCGECDGRQCDGCERLEVPTHWRLDIDAVPKDKLYEALIDTGLDKDIAYHLAYVYYQCETHWLDWNCQPPEEIHKQLDQIRTE